MVCGAISSYRDKFFDVKARESSTVTTVALVIVSIVCLTAGSGLLGMGLSRRYMSMGIALIPYLSGFFVLTIGIGTLLVSVPFCVVGGFSSRSKAAESLK